MTDRIQTILRSLDLSPSQLADEISVQRSSLSHILSGRNKPSLDFISKVLASYPQIDPDWLLFGKGSMLRRKNSSVEPVDPPAEEQKTEVREDIQQDAEVKEAVKGSFVSRKKSAEGSALPAFSREPGQIILFYDDNTFRIYTPS